MTDHPFSQYLRILGKGPISRRSLTEAEASDALGMILSGQVTDKQLGAFLLLMRANGETPDELIGFVKGIRQALDLNEKQGVVELDWAAYAGKWRYPPYFLLAIKLLTQNGTRVLLHGDAGQFSNRQYVESFLEPLNFYQASSIMHARDLVSECKATYLPLENFAPDLREILHLKSELGVRTVFNTAVKLLNPLNAPASIQGIFHKGVESLHHSTAMVIGTEHNLVFKGEGGEAEIRPDALTQLYFSTRNATGMRQHPFKGIIERQIRPKEWQQQDIIDLWRGDKKDLYGESSVVATTATALMLLDSLSEVEALAKAKGYWARRKIEC
ncbi:Anthranilate phosphoribosyltransferase [Hydrogenovibrio crunogenus]|uniref:Anthranilate phosphoribosyltransferase n=1 Tax=Hydrogenovibrio crunogenus TaxID=39765 RepID=A0A4P7NZP8_9GAMM|nr:glycosyl transferase family protein [Hydrogenovibrio crunogenus]QBZ83188.1 Anthranilate phosphoribosyltransferase [Hydrogenovibrio crunogenus]